MFWSIVFPPCFLLMLQSDNILAKHRLFDRPNVILYFARQLLRKLSSYFRLCLHYKGTVSKDLGQGHWANLITLSVFQNHQDTRISLVEDHAHTGDRLNIKTPSYQYRDNIIKIRRPDNRLIFINQIQRNLYKATTKFCPFSRQVVFQERKNKHDFVKTVSDK